MHVGYGYEENPVCSGQNFSLRDDQNVLKFATHVFASADKSSKSEIGKLKKDEICYWLSIFEHWEKDPSRAPYQPEVQSYSANSQAMQPQYHE